MVVHERLGKQIDGLKHLEISGKFGGASGNFNAHKIAFPEKNWIAFGNAFLKQLGIRKAAIHHSNRTLRWEVCTVGLLKEMVPF